MPDLDLGEWERRDASDPALKGRTLDDPDVARAARSYERADALRISEGRDGLVIEARQHVGVVQLGDLRVRVRPKVPARTLWTLLVYGLELDDLPLHPPVDMALDGSVPDLLAAMLAVEAKRLWRQGLRRTYVGRNEWLDAPRGRPDLPILSRALPLTRAALPCRYEGFTTDNLDNRVVLAGLALAGRSTTAVGLRARLHRAVQQWSTVCKPIHVTETVLDAADRARSRLAARYASAHRLVRALVSHRGPDEQLAAGQVVLPGALWNMARLFERVVARFLAEHLPSGLTLETQHHLRQLYSVDAGHGHCAPDPRPDLLVRQGRTPVAVLDTKYRDLSRTSLPPDMLYQLSVYSLAFGGATSTPAVVLYAVPDGDRPEARYRLHVAGAADRVIVLRAVPLDRLARLVKDRAGGRAEASRLVGWPLSDVRSARLRRVTAGGPSV